jgi:Sulfotransferase domain
VERAAQPVNRVLQDDDRARRLHRRARAVFLSGRVRLCRARWHTRHIRASIAGRHPREIIASRYPLDPGASIDKVGFESLFEVFTEAARLTCHDPVVIDAADLVASPAAIIRAYCERVGIAFLPQALTWSPEDRPEWELSSRWHTEAAASTSFAPPPAAGSDPGVDVERHPVLSGYLSRHLPFYAELHARRLTV